MTEQLTTDKEIIAQIQKEVNVLAQKISSEKKKVAELETKKQQLEQTLEKDELELSG